MRRLEGEAEARQAALAHLQATCGQQTATMTLLERQRDEERARRCSFAPPPPRASPTPACCCPSTVFLLPRFTLQLYDLTATDHVNAYGRALRTAQLRIYGRCSFRVHARRRLHGRREDLSARLDKLQSNLLSGGSPQQVCTHPPAACGCFAAWNDS